jgi:hypothetical protein
MTDCETVDDKAEEAIANERLNITSHSKIETLLTKCSEWLDVQDEANATQVLLLFKICYMASQKARGILKQKKMTDYNKK